MESHKRCFLWIDEWLDLTEEDIRRMEAENESILRKVNLKYSSLISCLNVVFPALKESILV